MESNFMYLIQSTRLIKSGKYNDGDINFIYELLISIDYDILILYYKTSTLIEYINDLELYIQLVNFVITYFEEKEEYEKCLVLNKKIIESKDIKSQN